MAPHAWNLAGLGLLTVVVRFHPPVTVDEFAEALGSGLRRPSLFRAPETMLRLALGESASALLASQRAEGTIGVGEGWAGPG